MTLFQLRFGYLDRHEDDRELCVGKDLEDGRGVLQCNYPSICLDGMKKNTKNLSSDSW